MKVNYGISYNEVISVLSKYGYQAVLATEIDNGFFLTVENSQLLIYVKNSRVFNSKTVYNVSVFADFTDTFTHWDECLYDASDSTIPLEIDLLMADFVSLLNNEESIVSGEHIDTLSLNYCA